MERQLWGVREGLRGACATAGISREPRETLLVNDLCAHSHTIEHPGSHSNPACTLSPSQQLIPPSPRSTCSRSWIIGVLIES